MTDQIVARPEIRVAGSELSEPLYEHLVSTVVEQSVHLPSRVVIRISDPDFETFDMNRFSIGSPLSVGFTQSGTTTQVIGAEIVALSVEPGADGRHELVIEGLGKGQRLARGSKYRTFEEVTDVDVVSSIATEYGLNTDADSTSYVHQYLMQNSNDFQFLTNRALAIGFEWWVTESTLHFKKKPEFVSAPPLKWPDDLYSFKVRLSAAESIGHATIRGWDPDNQQSFEGVAQTVANSQTLGTSATAATESEKAGRAFPSSRFSGLAPAKDRTEAEALAEAVVSRSLGEQMVARGVATGQPKLKPGSTVEITGVGDKLSGSYDVTEVQHVYRVGDRYTTRFVCGGREAATLVDLLGSKGDGDQARVGGRLMIGIVSDLEDPEDGGRVKVAFPALGDDHSSAWARLAGQGGGSRRGMLLYPEISDEVLVGFEDGDPRKPLILAGLWSQKNVPPKKTSEAIEDSEVRTRGWYSRTGHRIEMADGTDPANKSITSALSDEKTSLVLAEDNVALTAPSRITITGEDDVVITTSSGDVTISASSISLSATEKLSLSAPQIEISGSASVAIDGGKTDVKADGMMNVQAGGITQIKGSLVQLN